LGIACSGATRFLIALLSCGLFPTASLAQDASPDSHPHTEAVASQDPEPVADGHAEGDHRRIFGIIPNYRTSPTLKDYQPLTPKDKLRVATADAFDRGTVVLAALFAGQAEWTNATPSFGRGIPAYARYSAAAFGDFVVGDFMTEVVYPAALRQDPRYFRRGTGNGWARFGYAVGQIFWTHTDSGGTQFNLSEIAGNATAVAIGNAYYPGNHAFSSDMSKLSMQIGVDVAANILKEFSPDLERLFSRRHPPKAPRP
jgi:hypothetical protein